MKTLLFIPFLFIYSMVIGQSTKIIGTPIKIGSLEVAENDFPKEINWYDAVKACTDLGSGWRLPTKDELNLLYINKDKIGGFAKNYYWSSTELDSYNAWRQGFSDGDQFFVYMDDGNAVRAIRSF